MDKLSTERLRFVHAPFWVLRVVLAVVVLVPGLAGPTWSGLPFFTRLLAVSLGLGLAEAVAENLHLPTGSFHAARFWPYWLLNALLNAAAVTVLWILWEFGD
jgi:hypothetical protein